MPATSPGGATGTNAPVAGVFADSRAAVIANANVLPLKTEALTKHHAGSASEVRSYDRDGSRSACRWAIFAGVMYSSSISVSVNRSTSFASSSETSPNRSGWAPAFP